MRQPLVVRAALAATFFAIIIGGARASAAADRVKVVVATATIRAEASATSRAVAVVAAGTVLDVVGRQGAWYKVSVHAGVNRAQRPGFIEERLVVPTTERAVLIPVGPQPPVAARPGGRPAARREPVRIRVFGEGAVQAFRASGSFDAIFGSSTGVLYGGGVDVRFGNLFVQGGVTHFQKTGQRAFVDGGQTFRLGISDRVSITPITVNVGYRLLGSTHYTAYAGAGVGAVAYSETADFAASGDNFSKTGPAFQVLAGVEVPIVKMLAVALEGQYQSVRSILGTTGVSQALGEKDLGGASVRVKILFGK